MCNTSRVHFFLLSLFSGDDGYYFIAAYYSSFTSFFFPKLITTQYPDSEAYGWPAS